MRERDRQTDRHTETRETERHRRKEEINLVIRDSWKVSFCEDGSLNCRSQIGCFKMNLILV